jgi:hypothetical protein
MSPNEAREAAAEALFTAITQRLEWLKKDTDEDGTVDAEALETLANASAALSRRTSQGHRLSGSRRPQGALGRNGGGGK